MTNCNDCYQVKVRAPMNNELKCLVEKLGTDMFVVKTDQESLRPRILDVQIDECDCDTLIFTLYVALPVIRDPSDNIVSITATEFVITTSGHLKPCVVIIFTVYPLPLNTSCRGFDTECHKFDYCRVPCRRLVEPGFGGDKDCGCGCGDCDDEEGETYDTESRSVVSRSKSNVKSCADKKDNKKSGNKEAEDDESSTMTSRSVVSCVNSLVCQPNCFKVTFPMTKEVACTVPDFGLSGFYLKNITSGNMKVKVRLVPRNFVPQPNTGQIPAALLSYDHETCRACLEFCEDDYETITAGYEYLFNYLAGDVPQAPTIESMSFTRKFEVKGVAKCTEKTLFVFDLCLDPPLVRNTHNVMNYRIMPDVMGDVCYEFYCEVTQ